MRGETRLHGSGVAKHNNRTQAGRRNETHMNAGILFPGEGKPVVWQRDQRWFKRLASAADSDFTGKMISSAVLASEIYARGTITIVFPCPLY